MTIQFMNKPTLIVANSIMRDEDSYFQWKMKAHGLTKRELVRELKTHFREKENPLTTMVSMYSTLLNYSLAHIHWDAIANILSREEES